MTHSRPKRRNPARITYDREALIWSIVSVLGRTIENQPERIADAYEAKRKRGKDKPCQAVVHSGPGHQSESFCKVRGGPAGHDKDDQGRLLHYNENGEWTDDRPYIDYWG